MHPLLTPNTHADLEIVARNLAGSGSFGSASPAQVYTKILFGSLLSLTITESLGGITVDEKSRIIVEKPLLIERVLSRHENCEVKVIQKEEDVCELNFFFNKKIAGQIKLTRAEVEQKVPPITKQELYELTLIRGVQQAFPSVFSHKFYLRYEVPMSQQQQINTIVEQSGNKVLRADQLTVPKHPKNSALSPTAQKIVDWQKGYHNLSLDDPRQWDAHLAHLKGFDFLNDSQKDDLYDELIGHGISVGVEYSGEFQRFYLPQMA